MLGVDTVASALLGAVFQNLFEKLNLPGFLAFVGSSKFRREVDKMTMDLKMIQLVLDDAENKRLEDDAVKTWMDYVQDVIYDLEDILDAINTKELHQKHSKISDCISGVSFKPKIMSEIEEIASRLGDLRAWMRDLNLQRRVRGELSSATSEQERRKRETTSMVNESQIFGRDEEKRKLTDLLLKSPSDSQKVHVISVVGMGGMGKTTLVKLVYNSDEVKQYFDMIVWVYVSPQFQIQRMMEAILRQVGGKVPEKEISLEEVLKKIKEMIASKKLLIVLDDVWKRNPEGWGDAQNVFTEASQQTKVIITSRAQDVASNWGTSPDGLIDLKKLPNEVCWSIFKEYAFENRDIEACGNLESIGLQIVEKCGGLPLAARSIGALLRHKTHEDEWNSILHNNIWKLNANELGILPALGLSYSDLPSHLKQCFAYCAIFPKGYRFEEHEVVLMWMAAGFLRWSKEEEIEDIGHVYFHNLLLRSLFLPSPHDKSKYVMHDLISDLAQWAAGKICLQLGDTEKQLKEARQLVCNTRYASYGGGIEYVKILHEEKKLRAFVDMDFHTPHWSRSHFKIVKALISKSGHLRILSLRHRYEITKVPTSISGLKQLRYLDFSNTQIRLVPKSICNLTNLQTIILRDCSNLKKLPEELRNLVKLHHLDFSGSHRIRDMPSGMGKLTLLRMLSSFLIGNDFSNGIQELKSLNYLCTLSISNLQNVMDPLNAKQAMLKNKSKLKTLSMKWYTSDSKSNTVNDTVVDEVFEELQPSQKLEELSINGFPGTKFPTWLSDLISLRELHIIHCPELVQTLSCRFPKLEDLEVINCNMMKVSILSSSMLQTIKVRGCRKVEFLKDIKVSGTVEEGSNQVSDIVEEGSIQEVINLREMIIERVSNQELMELPFRIGRLELKSCLFKKLPSELYAMTSTFELDIKNCDNLESLAEKLQFPDNSDNSKFTLDISIEDCGAMESIPLNMMHGGMFLIKMTLSACHSLVIFAKGVLPVTLKELDIELCHNLQTLVEENVHSNNIVSNPKAVLEKLRIVGCSLKCLASTTRGELPFRMKSLEIVDCENLTSLLQTSLSSGASLSSGFELLEELDIWGASAFTAFILNEGFQSINDTLRVLDLMYPNRDRCFKPIKEWGLHRLISLEELHLWGFEASEEAFSTADEDPILPSSLEHLCIRDFYKLKYLSHSVFQNLTSLNELDIWDCPELKSLPEGRLPLSLQRLVIWNCPLVKKRCEKNKGEDWPKISHIPYIQIDRKRVQQP